MRGDVILQTEDEGDATYRKALTDAYLRVVLLYTDDACKPVRQAAMLKAAQCLDKLRMASRAESMRNQARTL